MTSVILTFIKATNSRDRDSVIRGSHPDRGDVGTYKLPRGFKWVDGSYFGPDGKLYEIFLTDSGKPAMFCLSNSDAPIPMEDIRADA